MRKRVRNRLDAQHYVTELEGREMLMASLTPNSSVAEIEIALEAGGDVTFNPGTYNLSEGVRANVRNDLNVIATDANFVSQGVDDNLFTLVGTNGRQDNDITWTGGSFDISGSRLSTTRPFRGSGDSLRTAEANRRGDNREGASSSTDALSIRGNDKIDKVRIDKVSIKGSDTDWRTNAGGDSGVFVADANDIEVTNSQFRGIRDAGIYLSDAMAGESTSRALVENNLVVGSFDGVTAKRGIDNVTFRNNVLVNNDVGASLKINTAGTERNDTFENARFVGNFISNSKQTSILLEDADDVELISNRVFAEGRNEVIRQGNAIDIERVGQINGRTANFNNFERDNTITDRAANSTERQAAFQVRAERENTV